MLKCLLSDKALWCWRIALLLGLFGLSSCQSVPQGESQQSLSQAVEEQLDDWRMAYRHGDKTPELDKNSPDKRTTDIHNSPLSNELLIDIHAVAAPIESVLYALALDANLQLQLKDALQGEVTLLVNAGSLDNILKLISQQLTIHWEIDQGRLLIWGAQPYAQSYAVDYLNLDRTTLSSVGLATQVGSINAGLDGATANISNSSETLITNKALHRFWDSLEVDLEGMRSRYGTSSVNEGSNSILSYTVNRDAGIVTLFADAQAHHVLRQYLKRIHDSVRRQVLIEATVVEVTLSDDFKAGVDWQFLTDGVDGISAVQKLLGTAAVSASSVARLPSPSVILSLVKKSSQGSIGATMALLQQFGDIRILSRPRIIALNNQSSVLKVVDNRVYFTVNVDRKSTDSNDQISTETEIHTVPVGLVMNVTPHISAQNEVMLNVRPSMSRIIGFVNDPNPELAVANVNNGVPEIQVREMESMLRVRSGELAVIGGLMQEVSENSRDELPGLASLPGFGRFFSSKKRSRRQTELLVVLRPTVMSDADISFNN